MGRDAYPVVTHPYKFNNSYGWVGISHCAILMTDKIIGFMLHRGAYLLTLPELMLVMLL